MEIITQGIRIFAKWPAIVAMVGTVIFFAREYKHHPKLFFREVSLTALVTATAWLIATVLKITIRAPRPFVNQGIENTFMVYSYTSFPSGHATLFFALATIVFFYSRRTGAILYLFATVIATARVLAGIHYPIDVIVGAIIGITIAWLFYTFVNPIFSKKNL